MKTVITYGTFDMFHHGHYRILERAREYGDYLIVGVTGENYDISRGKMSVKDSLAERIENVKKTGFADKIIVEEYLGQKISDIIRYDVDIFVIGDDWKGKFDHLSNYCEVVYLERTEGISSTFLREQTNNKHSIGVITDIIDDNQIANEASKINGLQVTAVFSESCELAEEFAKKYEIAFNCRTTAELFNHADIINIETSVEKRYKYSMEAIIAGKHVICESPVSLKKEEYEQLYKTAEEHNVVFIENIKMLYTSIFNQLLWITQGGLIGDIVSFKCAISKNDFSRKNLFYDFVSSALYLMIKILGTDYKQRKFDVIKSNSNDRDPDFATLQFDYDNCNAIINVGNRIRVENIVEIVGTNGTITMQDNWWRGTRFQLTRPGSKDVEVYNMNSSGNGFRFLLKAVLNAIDKDKTKMKTVRDKEIQAISEIIQAISMC